MSEFEGQWHIPTEALLKEIIKRIGDDPNREGLEETPERVVASWHQLFAGYKTDPSSLLKTFDGVQGYDQVVLLKDIEFYSTCEHHMLPFNGVGHIAYLPGDRIVGISKLARLLEAFSRRLQVQERITQQVTSALMEHLKPKGAACVLEAKHMCMTCRGVNKQNSTMVTSSMQGVFLHEASARAELLQLIAR